MSEQGCSQQTLQVSHSPGPLQKSGPFFAYCSHSLLNNHQCYHRHLLYDDKDNFMRRPLIAGNWKMNGDRVSVTKLLVEIKAQATQVNQAELAVMPPSVYLELVQNALTHSAIKWGAQDVSAHADGAFTGEISASMLADFNCDYVIVGHSERRQLLGETNELVAQKSRAALLAKLRPIVCIGETLAQREAGKTLEIIYEQLAAVLRLEHNLLASYRLVVAYEPIWAIGTGKTATPAEAQIVHQAIRRQLSEHHVDLAQQTRLLYGGSVKPDNAAAILTQADIDGVLVGGASLNAKSFIEIGGVCNQLY